MSSAQLLKQIAILVAVAVVGFALYGLTIAPVDALPLFNPQEDPWGNLIINAQDGLTKEPLCDVTVVIPETGQRYVTDQNGQTGVITVPIVSDAAYTSILPQTWGEITVLAYKAGYADYAVFHVQVWENQTRYGPTLMMFSNGDDVTGQPFTLTEGPHRLWVQQLLDRFRNPQ
ncbi:MAG: hypothetical protein PHO66_08475 [Eubacteriales bacterium]|nr:hypothetical protein [Eubacteriales bacterium]